MDTREKIVTPEALRAALGQGDWILAVGYFDPLTAAQAQRVRQLRQPNHRLAVVVLSDQNALLPAEARAALMAALSDVDLVTTGALSEWRDVCDPKEVNLDKERSDQFVQFVLRRQSVAS